MKKIVLSALIAGAIFLSQGLNMALAQEINANLSTEARLSLITSLNAQIQELKNKILSLTQDLQAKQIEVQANAAVLSRTLGQGSSGDDVRILQAILATDASIYPSGTITGFYGPATAKAVAKFQAKYNLAAVGKVGPQTLARLNALASSGEFCAKIAPGHLIARGWLKKNEMPVVPACQMLPPGIEDRIDDHDDELKISAVTAVNIMASGATIKWRTDEEASSKVYYSTTTPVNKATAQTAARAEMAENHSISLTGLSANTRYYFLVESTDEDGKVAVSAEAHFMTLAAADTVNPTVSITSPAANATVSGNQTVTAEANDNVGVVKVELYIDGVLKLSDLVSPYSFSWDTTNGGAHPCNGNHNHTLQAKAYDAAGNVGVSSNVVVNMHKPAYCDNNTPPVISAQAAVSITATGAVITWTTSENSTSKVYYSTTAPLNTSTALNATVGGSVTAHSVPLTGLTASTRYYVVVESSDSDNNKSTSAEFYFDTLAQ